MKNDERFYRDNHDQNGDGVFLFAIKIALNSKCICILQLKRSETIAKYAQVFRLFSINIIIGNKSHESLRHVQKIIHEYIFHTFYSMVRCHKEDITVLPPSLMMIIVVAA